MGKCACRLLNAVAATAFFGAIVTAGVYQQASRGKKEVITFDEGGVLTEFIDRYNKGREAGTRYVLDGVCISACTLITGLIPNERVCATPFGKLAFHSAWTMSAIGPRFAAEGTRLVWHIYPEKIRALLKTKFNWNGDDKDTGEHPELIYVEGDDLRSIYEPCKES